MFSGVVGLGTAPPNGDLAVGAVDARPRKDGKIGRRGVSRNQPQREGVRDRGSIRPVSTPLRRALPNSITLLRLGLAAVFFVMLERLGVEPSGPLREQLGFWTTVLFAVAALSDILDGYLARRWAVVSAFGRIMDPLVDKTLVIGGFIYMSSQMFAADPSKQLPGSAVSAWMVVVLLVRELLVSGIRAHAEGRGIAFPADWSGKIKMFVQSFCVGACVYVSTRSDPNWVLLQIRDTSVWATVVLTVLSSLTYLRRAATISFEVAQRSGVRS